MESDPENLQNNSDSIFVWDESSQLYFHASSGFYHDPNAGWYYSTRDGLYYKFEDGNYVLLGSDKVNDREEEYLCKETASEDPTLPGGSGQQKNSNDNEKYSSFIESTSEVHQQMGTIANEVAVGPAVARDKEYCKVPLNPMDCMSNPTCEKPPPPPSEWLEDTLIDLYLSGYNNPAACATDTLTVPLETDDGTKLAADDTFNCATYELEEGEWIPEDDFGIADTVVDEGFSDEEKWRAQYGQVIDSGKELVSEFPVVDLWEWEIVIGSRKDEKDKSARLVGRLVKRSTKHHPSIASGGGKFRSAPICEAHLDLVRVKTGQIYKLRNPSASYLASLSTYDSANPTKDWDFAPLSDWKVTHISKPSESAASASDGVCTEKDLLTFPNHLAASKQSCRYRDRAAERRMLHGVFSVGPGQKNSVGSDDDDTSPGDSSPQEAAAEALEMSFGEGSYARKILKGMGWKEGERLGSTSKGLLEPIQPVGNIGNAGGMDNYPAPLLFSESRRRQDGGPAKEVDQEMLPTGVLALLEAIAVAVTTTTIVMPECRRVYVVSLTTLNEERRRLPCQTPHRKEMLHLFSHPPWSSSVAVRISVSGSPYPSRLIYLATQPPASKIHIAG
ncbi:RNA-binding protein 5-A [Senna tora]|uniref:RNA-binding protein 5-A n=1 Tax=Senna tora TaxID=362788 RepID=A0A834X5P7_9FABA|nr:RNA-binding protein 5-A [Senna tora]